MGCFCYEWPCEHQGGWYLTASNDDIPADEMWMAERIAGLECHMVLLRELCERSLWRDRDRMLCHGDLAPCWECRDLDEDQGEP